MSRFTAKRADGRPRWRVVADLAMAAEFDAVLPYDLLLAELETDDRQTVYRACKEANRKALWLGGHRSLGAEPGVGYRVLRPEEHETQARGFQKSSRRKLENAVAVIEATDLAEIMDVAKRERVVQLGMVLVTMARAVDSIARKQAKTDDMIAALDARLRKVEATKDG